MTKQTLKKYSNVINRGDLEMDQSQFHFILHICNISLFDQKASPSTPVCFLPSAQTRPQSDTRSVSCVCCSVSRCALSMYNFVTLLYYYYYYCIIANVSVILHGYRSENLNLGVCIFSCHIIHKTAWELLYWSNEIQKLGSRIFFSKWWRG